MQSVLAVAIISRILKFFSVFEVGKNNQSQFKSEHALVYDHSWALNLMSNTLGYFYMHPKFLKCPFASHTFYPWYYPHLISSNGLAYPESWTWRRPISSSACSRSTSGYTGRAPRLSWRSGPQWRCRVASSSFGSLPIFVLGSSWWIQCGPLRQCCRHGETCIFNCLVSVVDSTLIRPDLKVDHAAPFTILWLIDCLVMKLTNTIAKDSKLLKDLNIPIKRGAAIAQWINLHLQFCRTGFESQAHHLSFHNLLSNLCYICHVKRTKINKRGRVWPIF